MHRSDIVLCYGIGLSLTFGNLLPCLNGLLMLALTVVDNAYIYMRDGVLVGNTFRYFLPRFTCLIEQTLFVVLCAKIYLFLGVALHLCMRLIDHDFLSCTRC